MSQPRLRLFLTTALNHKRHSHAIRLGLLALLTCALMGSASRAYSADWLYTVRPGDTFWDLCLRYTKKPRCWQELPDLNNVTRTRQLPPGYIIRIPVSWLKQAPTPVTVEYLSGDVYVKPPANTGTPINKALPTAPLPNTLAPRLDTASEQRAVAMGEKIAIGSTVITENGYASLLFADGSTLLVMPYSAVSMDAFTTHNDQFIVDSRMRLLEGRVKAKVKKREPRSRFNITTPDAVAAVRGTEFQVSTHSTNNSNSTDASHSAPQTTPSEPEGTRIEVFEGLVAVGDEQSEHEVAEGFGIQASQSGGLTAPKALLTAPTLAALPEAVSLPYTVQWQALEEAKAYQLELFSHSENGSLNLHSHFRLTEASKAFSSLPPMCYSLELAAIDNEGFQGMKTEAKLCVSDFVPAPVIHRAKFKRDDALHISWAPVDQAAHYEIHIAKEATFSDIEYSFTVTDTELRKVLDEQIDKKKNTQPVFIRVRAIGQDTQASEYSDTVKVLPKKSDWQGVLFIVVAFLASL